MNGLFLREQFTGKKKKGKRKEREKKKGSFGRERENGEEVPDCSCFSSREKIAVWQRIKYSKL